jgi:hypothetical protein
VPASASWRLAKNYGRERLEAACGRALAIGARSYSSVNSILKNNLDRQQPIENVGGPGRTRTSNQTVMSGRL